MHFVVDNVDELVFKVSEEGIMYSFIFRFSFQNL